METMTTETRNTQSAEEFADQLLEKASTALDIFGMYLGDQLGFYEVLAQDGALSPAELSSRTGTHMRYVREWMEHQAVAGILQVEDASAPAEQRRFLLPADRREVLADRDSMNYMAPLLQGMAGAVRPLGQVLRAFREGGGVPYSEYGADLREGQGRMNRVVLLQQLGKSWIPAMPDVHARLMNGGMPRVADFGCGVGWSSIGVALAYPHVRVDGFDLDEPSVARARGNAAEYGVQDRVQFAMRDAADPELAGQYDLAMAMECIHDMANPVGALRTMRKLVRNEGTVLVVDERVGEDFNPNAGLVEKLMYGFSVLHCLPVGMADQPSAGTGTVMRPGTFREYAKQAGFRDIQTLPVENPLFRLYRLQP